GRAGEDGKSGQRNGVADAGYLLGHGRELAHQCVGPIKRGGVGKLYGSNEVALILCGDECSRYALEAKVRQEKQAAINKQRDKPEADNRPQQPDIAACGRMKAPVEQSEEPAQDDVDHSLKPVLLAGAWQQ